jgi:hypothetical protein
MFYVSALFLQDFVKNLKPMPLDELKKEILDYSQSVFIAIFAMMFGAMSAGQSQ